MTISRLLKNTVGTAMLAGALMLAPQVAQARVFVSVGFAPPAIPVYEQPICPGDGYIWTPGYWAYTDDGYEWVDGAWVLAPYTGALWTPGYWGYDNGAYLWNAGYWGPTVGYYGGINYGFGYFGVGFYGGYWNHGAFFYNRAYGHFGGGFRGDHFYNQRYANYDGRPGGTSFARGGGYDANRGGSFNNATNRGGFGQNGGRSTMVGAINTPYRGANPVNDSGFANNNSHGNYAQNAGRSTMVGQTNAPYRGEVNSGNVISGPSGFAGNRGGYRQPIQPRTTGNYGGFGGNSGVQQINPGSSFRPSQGGTVQSNPGRSGTPTSGFQGGASSGARPSGSFQGGSSNSGFHGGGGGGGSHGGGHR